MVKTIFQDADMSSQQNAVINVFEEDINVVSIEVLWKEVATENENPINGVLNIYSSHGLGKCLEKSIDIQTLDNSADTTIVDITGPTRQIYLAYIPNAITEGKLSATAVLRRI